MFIIKLQWFPLGLGKAGPSLQPVSNRNWSVNHAAKYHFYVEFRNVSYFVGVWQPCNGQVHDLASTVTCIWPWAFLCWRNKPTADAFLSLSGQQALVCFYVLIGEQSSSQITGCAFAPKCLVVQGWPVFFFFSWLSVMAGKYRCVNKQHNQT